MNNEWGSGTYRGPIVNGKAEGFGTWTCTDGPWKGSVYEGHFKDHRFHGQGTCTFANGDQYIGAWENDERHGQGTMTWADGDQYIGAYENDKRHGLGTETTADGDKYIGAYENDERHGQGTMTWADGSILHSGLWKDDDPVPPPFVPSDVRGPPF
jgi:hypothetical protein